MLQLAKVHEGDMVIDLGSGDGRIIITAAKEFKGSWDRSGSDPAALVRWNIRRHGLTGQVKVLGGTFFDYDLRARVVAVYQNPEVNDKLRSKFKRELKPGTRIVSRDFIFERWTHNKRGSESNSYCILCDEWS